MSGAPNSFLELEMKAALRSDGRGSEHCCASQCLQANRAQTFSISALQRPDSIFWHSRLGPRLVHHLSPPSPSSLTHTYTRQEGAQPQEAACSSPTCSPADVTEAAAPFWAVPIPILPELPSIKMQCHRKARPASIKGRSHNHFILQFIHGEEGSFTKDASKAFVRPAVKLKKMQSVSSSTSPSSGLKRGGGAILAILSCAK